MNVYKSDFIKQLMEKYNYTKSSATSVVDDFWSVLTENLEQGNAVFFYGFGCFDIIERKARSCINPQTKERCSVPGALGSPFLSRQYDQTCCKEVGR